MTPRAPAPDDLASVRALLGPLDPVPDAALAREDVMAARASVGLARVGGGAPPVRQPRGRFVAAGAVAVLSVATLVAVVTLPTSQGGDTLDLATGPGARAVSSAYAATAGSGSARGLLTVSSGGRTVTATGVGDFNGGAGRAEIALAGGGAGAPPTRITVIRTGGAIFARLPSGTNPLAADKPWVSVDAATLARLTQLALGDLGAQVTGAPLDALAYLRAVSGDVQVVGPDTVRGEATTRYRGTVDLQKVAEQLPAALRAEAVEGAGKAPLAPAELWIDDQGRLRKLALRVDVLAPEAPQRRGLSDSVLGTVTVELWDFGTPVEASAPPPDQVVDVGGALGGFLGGAGRP